ncbi:MAG: hypothetical protein LBE91_18130 [Tannerella sp.]|nr:hypothetical protein [Tannerella sp.]
MKTNILKSILYAIILGSVAGCGNGEMDLENGETEKKDAVLWQAYPNALIGDGKIILTWQNFHLTSYFYDPDAPKITDPDFFVLYQSEDNEKYVRIAEIERDATKEQNTHVIDGLTNGKTYYFHIVTEKKGLESKTSAAIMTVPNPQKGYEVFLEAEGRHTLWLSSLSSDRKKIAYVDVNYTWDNGNYGTVAAFFSNMDGTEQELIGLDYTDPVWLPGENRLLFRMDKGNTADIAVFDCATKSVTSLTRDEKFNYFPAVSANGKQALYLSDKNYFLLDFQTGNIQPVVTGEWEYLQRPEWIDNGNFVFSGREAEKPNQLYRASVSDGKIQPLIPSEWNDYNPVVSPDGKKIAFISERSGVNQVWVYSFETRKYRQMTGYSENDYFYTDWQKINWQDNSTVVFTLVYTPGERHRLVRQSVE